jgi:hypothetical protein
MASAVDICNAALSHIGDTANVTSIYPPDGSAQAGYCATFYKLAVAAILETHTWGFATVRSRTAPVWSNLACGTWNPLTATWTPGTGTGNPDSSWRFAYAYPANVVTMIAVLPEHALDDYSANFGERHHRDWTDMHLFAMFANPAENMYMPERYAVEQDGKGNKLILTNAWNPVFRYVINEGDPTKFSPLFVFALSYLLASMLAGPIMKGEEGAQMSAGMVTKFQSFNAQAKASDANQRHIEVKQRVSWMAGR